MIAIHTALRRGMIVLGLPVVLGALLRLYRHYGPQRIEPTEPTMPPEPCAPLTATEDDTEVYAEEADPEEAFREWEAQRNERLVRIQDLEQQGLVLLGKAALLRAAVKCDDRGEGFFADELRDQADKIDASTLNEVPACAGEGPMLRLARFADEAPLPRGA
jgi:hypothetical protein